MKLEKRGVPRISSGTQEFFKSNWRVEISKGDRRNGEWAKGENQMPGARLHLVGSRMSLQPINNNYNKRITSSICKILLMWGTVSHFYHICKENNSIGEITIVVNISNPFQEVKDNRLSDCCWSWGCTLVSLNFFFNWKVIALQYCIRLQIFFIVHFSD